MYTAIPKHDPLVDDEEDDDEPRGIPMHPPDWEAYESGQPAVRCRRCGGGLVQGTLFHHCAVCLATRRIEEATLIQASARVVEGLWPLGEERLDGRRWAHALIALWRGVIDPTLMRAFPYNTNTLDMTLSLMKQRLLLTDALVRVPDRYGYSEVVLRSRGETLALGVATIDLRRDAPELGVPMNPEQQSLDTLLDYVGLTEGWLIVEKTSRRARRDDPVNEKTVISARGHRVHRLECSNEVRF